SALISNDHRLVTHCGYVRATRGARTQYCGELRNPLCAHPRLIEEDSTEVLTIREDLVLPRQERPAGVDEIQARQLVLQRDLLRAKVLLDRHRQIASALHRGVVAEHHHMATVNQADSCDHSGAGRFSPVKPIGSQGCDFEKRAALIEQPCDALTRQQLAAS